MTEQSTPDLSQMSPDDIVNYLKGRYLKPRWPHWQNMGEVSLHEAVWLSFNVEPFGDEIDAHKGAEGISRRLPHVMQRYSIYLIDTLREDYDQRMMQCIANIMTKKLPSAVTLGMVGEVKRCPVSLVRFRQWGESLPVPYTFPDEFPPGTPPANTSSEKPNWAVWSATSKVRAWQGVALSLNIEPTSIRRTSLGSAKNADSWARLGVDVERVVYTPIAGGALLLDTRIAKDFNQRLGAAIVEFDKLQPRPKESDDGLSADVYLSLPTFAAWAVRLGWRVPPEFSALVDFVSITDILRFAVSELVNTHSGVWQKGSNNRHSRAAAEAFTERYLSGRLKELMNSSGIASINGSPGHGPFFADDAAWGVSRSDAERLRELLRHSELPNSLWSEANLAAEIAEKRSVTLDAQGKAKRAAGRYTILEAYIELARVTGWQPNRWRDRILRDIRAGKLSLRNPADYTDRLPYAVPIKISMVSDQVDADGLNTWLDANPEWSVSYRFKELESGRIAGFMTFNKLVKAIMDQARSALSADEANGSQGAVPNGARQGTDQPGLEISQRSPDNARAQLAQVGKQRRDLLDPLIDKAIAAASSHDPAVVFARLREMAINEERPLNGVDESGGLIWTPARGKKTHSFTLDALRKRLARRQTPPPTTGR